jgi:hypothetical protein
MPAESPVARPSAECGSPTARKWTTTSSSGCRSAARLLTKLGLDKARKPVGPSLDGLLGGRADCVVPDLRGAVRGPASVGPVLFARVPGARLPSTSACNPFCAARMGRSLDRSGEGTSNAPGAPGAAAPLLRMEPSNPGRALALHVVHQVRRWPPQRHVNLIRAGLLEGPRRSTCSKTSPARRHT